jgi:hypothetical protein
MLLSVSYVLSRLFPGKHKNLHVVGVNLAPVSFLL